MAMLMSAERSTLLVVDVQERLLPAMAAPEAVVKGNSVLLRAAARLKIPAVISEQYPRGLGPTVDVLKHLAPAKIAEKMHFSCADSPEVAAEVAHTTRHQVVIAGIEAHVCVLQTALGFRARGLEVFVAADACSSRNPANAELAFDRMRQAGIQVVSVEMVVFEWLACAGTPEFKDLSALIK